MSKKANTYTANNQGNTVLIAVTFRSECLLGKQLTPHKRNSEHENNTVMTTTGFAKMLGRNNKLDYLTYAQKIVTMINHFVQA